MTLRYSLAPQCVFRVVGPGTFEARQRRDAPPIVLPHGLWPIVAAFALPRTPQEVREEQRAGMTQEEFANLVTMLLAAGVLHKHEQAPPGRSLQELLRQDVFGDAARVAEIGSYLRAGRLVVVQNAIAADLAQRVHAALDASQAWKAYEGSMPYFHYRHHNLYDPVEYPEPLRECASIFKSDGTRKFVQDLSGVPCDGPAEVSASWYQPGDHSLPHQDSSGSRSVAFIWHLTQDWDNRWGGHLVWCPTGTLVRPQFNCLSLFTVDVNRSMHFVAVVSSSARSKRLAVNGWWTRLAAPTAPSSKVEPSGPLMSRAIYGPPPIELGGADAVTIV